MDELRPPPFVGWGAAYKPKEQIVRYELKPCPFCGGEAELKSQNECEGHGCYSTYHFVKCTQCYCTGARMSDYFFAKEDCRASAAEAWNRRVSDD